MRGIANQPPASEEQILQAFPSHTFSPGPSLAVYCDTELTLRKRKPREDRSSQDKAASQTSRELATRFDERKDFHGKIRKERSEFSVSDIRNIKIRYIGLFFSQ